MVSIRDAFLLDIYQDAPGAEPRHIRAETLIAIRWVAIGGQAATVLAVHFGLGYDTQILSCAAAIAASALLNVFLQARYRDARRMRRRDAFLSLAFDAAQLAFLLGLTGGPNNPFAVLVLAPATVSASILPGRWTLWLTLFTAGLMTAVAIFHLPLPGPAPQLPWIYALAGWAAVVVGLFFVAGYVARVATEQQRMSQALGAVESTLRREQQVSAVGALAAAAAHELGTPLATITLVAKELSKDLPEGSEAAEDAALIVSQAERCREILAELSARPGEGAAGDSGERFYPISASALIREIAEPRQPEGVELEIIQRPISGDAGAEPRLARTPELINGLTNILSNALQFAVDEVTVSIAWSAKNLSITVVDDGRGFPPDLIRRIGEPYISTRRNQSGHMGLGLFIARTLLENTGATLKFANRPGAGAEVVASWSRAAIEEPIRE